MLKIVQFAHRLCKLTQSHSEMVSEQIIQGVSFTFFLLITDQVIGQCIVWNMADPTM